ncbi:MAG TPA: hypothetical protein VFG83_06595 [Kofleriaceae bacterium]|nr:hypothetical protein [Kofleriaceae bacterium]
MSVTGCTSTALDLFARAGHLTDGEVEAIFAVVGSGGAAVERLVDLGAVSEVEAADLLSGWTLVPRCAPGSLDHIEAEILARVPADVAIELRAIPAGAEPDGSLRVAMADPADERAATELAFFCGTDIVRETATVSEIARALARYPGHRLPAAVIVDDDAADLVIVDRDVAGRRTRLPPALIIDDDFDLP